MSLASVKRRAPQWLKQIARVRALPTRWWEHRLWLGFSLIATAELHRRATSPLPWRRSQARRALREWSAVQSSEEPPHVPQRYQAVPAGLRPTTTKASTFDVIIVSDFSLQGGTTSSNAQEIAAQRQAGLRTGLVHHPIWEWDVTKPIAGRIAEQVDGDVVQWIQGRASATCDVLVIRAPKLAEVMMSDLPSITAKSTAVILNQTPYYHYAPTPTGIAYDLPTVVRHVSETFGPATWFPIGPSVRDALNAHHREEMSHTTLADWDWVNIIDASAWKREGRRAADGRVRIGRHSRDDAVKWPEHPDALRAAYPVDGSVDVHILGGAQTAREVLGSVPKSWTVYPFGSRDVREFLHELDVYVYYTASTYTEAFGRAPLEAMAVGLPVVLPPSFEPLFGSGARYAEVLEVANTLRDIAGDPDALLRWGDQALACVEQRFSYSTHLDRLSKLSSGGS